MNDIGIGALTSGLAQGFGQGYRIRSDIEDRRSARDFQQRHIGIMEDNAGMNREVQKTQLTGMRREEQKAQADEDSWRAALSALDPAGAIDPSTPASEQLGRKLMSVKPTAAQWAAASNVLLRNGNAKGFEFMKFAQTAREEGAADALAALSRGDTKGAMRAFNAAGMHRLKDVRPAGEGPDGTPSGEYDFEYDDGTVERHNPDTAYEVLTSPAAYDRYVAEKRQRLQESQKTQAEIRSKDAQSFKNMGDNATQIRVAEINAGSREAVADKRGAGRGKGTTGGDDPFDESAKRRVEISKMVDEYVGKNFGEVDKMDGTKWSHNDKSRKLSAIASQLMVASIEGGKPMNVQDAAIAASQGSAVYKPAIQNERLVSTQMWRNGDVEYPMGAATKELTKDQVLQYIDSVGDGIRRKGNLTPEQVRDSTDIKIAARQAGMTVEGVVQRIMKGPATQKGASAAAAKGKGAAPGMVEAGNIDLTKRKVLNNPDGSISTESSITITEKGKDGKEIAVNLPTVIDGKRMSDKDAVAYYKRTGEHLGKFASIKEAESAAQNTHLDQEKRYANPAQAGTQGPDQSPKIEEARSLDQRIRALESRGDSLPPAAKRQLDEMRQRRGGMGITSAKIAEQDAAQELQALEENIARMRRTDTGIDRSRAQTIKNLEAKAAQLRSRMSGGIGITSQSLR